MSVEDIIQTARMRRGNQERSEKKQQLRVATPPTHEYIQQEQSYSPQIHFQENSTDQEYEQEPVPQTAPIPQQNSNDIIEKKVEEILK